jgi:hypothetical protein
MRICDGERPGWLGLNRTRRLNLGRPCGRSLGGSSSFGLRERRFFGANGLDPSRFEPRGFRGQSFLLRSQFSRCLRGACRRGSLFFRGSLYVGGLSAAAHRTVASGSCRFRNGLWNGDRSTTASGGCRSSLTLGADPLFALPASTNSGDLVVREHTHVATNRNVHLPKKRDDFVGGHCEFVSQLTH